MKSTQFCATACPTIQIGQNESVKNNTYSVCATASKMVTFIVITLSLIGTALAAEAWDYTDPSRWQTISSYQTCGGRRQSPIDLPPIVDMEYDVSLGQFSFHGFDRPGSKYNLTMQNNGHTVVVGISGDVIVKGGGLPYRNGYKLAQFHFHWGSDNNKGSEHTYSGQMFPLELHMVTYDTRYSDLSKAMPEQDGLAVLGFFFEIDDELDNCNYSPLVDLLLNIKGKGSTVTLDGYKLRHLMPRKFSHYFRYSGSLTTPPCHESVVWTVFLDRIKITSAQMQRFREVYEDTTQTKSMVNNYRPVQSLNGRKVTTTMDVDNPIGSANVNCALPVLTMLFMVVSFVFQ